MLVNGFAGEYATYFILFNLSLLLLAFISDLGF